MTDPTNQAQLPPWVREAAREIATQIDILSIGKSASSERLEDAVVDAYATVIAKHEAASRADGERAQAVVREYFQHFPCTCTGRGGRSNVHFAVCPITIRKELLERLASFSAKVEGEREMNPRDEAVAIAKQTQVDYAGRPDMANLIVTALSNWRDEEVCDLSRHASEAARRAAAAVQSYYADRLPPQTQSHIASIIESEFATKE